MALLRVANLKKSYKITKTQKQDVLKGVDIEFKSGDLVALLGESGCGKSTLLNILGGLDNDYSGSVIIKDEFIRDFTEKQMDDYRKKRVGLIFQNYNLIPHMTIKENVEIAMEMSDIKPKLRAKRTMELLKMMGLSKQATKLPNQLSGGQKQRVAIARALANNPTIILADEPTGALDEESTQIVMDILKRVAQSGKLVIIVTHSDKIASQCGRVLKMENGIIVSDDKVSKIKIDVKRDKEIKPRSIKTKDIAKLSVKNVWQKKSRSILVSLGLSIGMAAVLLFLCLGSGLTAYVKNVFAENILSTKLVVTYSSNSNFSSSDVSKIKKLDGVKSITETYTNYSAKYSYNNSEGADLNRLQCYYNNIFEPKILYGSLKNDTEDKLYIIINETLAASIGEGSLIAAVGQEITVTGKTTQTFVISGIYSDVFNDSMKNNAFISESAMKKLMDTSSLSINTLYVNAKDVTFVEDLQSAITKMRYKVDMEKIPAGTILSYIDIGTTILMAVSGVSMVVSAIMIFIVQYISVSERMKEIGILRAVGARKRDIRKLFIFEAGLIGMVGGILSILFCLAITLLTNIVCVATLKYALISYNVLYYLAGLAVSVLVSMLAGIAPAIRASDLDPVESLRAE